MTMISDARLLKKFEVNETARTNDQLKRDAGNELPHVQSMYFYQQVGRAEYSTKWRIRAYLIELKIREQKKLENFLGARLELLSRVRVYVGTCIKVLLCDIVKKDVEYTVKFSAARS